jgi:hypothetical protein
LKYGRRAREYDPRVPKMPVCPNHTLPPAVDYTAKIPYDFGAMLNDQLGDCTAAAVGHAIQVWSFNATGKMRTPSNAQIEKLYEATGGYVPGKPSTDQGAVEQTVLKYWLNNAVDGNELLAFVEIDVTDMRNVKQSVYEGGALYIGFNVPAYLQDLESPGAVWDAKPNADNTIIGGHAVVVTGYTEAGNLTLISWGNRYTMTAAFWNAFVDEAYVLADAAWIAAKGLSPAGLSLLQLETLMAAMRESGTGTQRRRHRLIKRRRRVG